MDVSEITGKLGLNPIEAMESLSKITEILPKVKSFLPMVKDWEKTLKLKEGQQIIYSLMPVNDEVFIYVFVIEQVDEKTLIVDTKYRFKGFEELSKLIGI